MKKVVLFHIIILLFSCNQANNKTVESSNLKETGTESNIKKDSIKELNNKLESAKTNPLKEDYKNITILFNLSPLSIFDKTTDGLSLSEKKELLKNGESDSWKIITKNQTQLAIQNKNNSSQVTFYFLKNKDNLDGLLCAEIVNGENNNIYSWKYFNKTETLQETNILKKYNANDFVSKADKLPDTYQPVLHYTFINNKTIEVSLYTWMEKEFETRKIVNKIFLIWNGDHFAEKIESIKN
ncbi:hypothetical protein [Formosa sp. L2A11]|uniref:hypothetical protein n=1 Tax=Formosa sp. L2A11 TaxID=2686363 RepID=UPI00131CC5ED|nr:hypothetical protein [Formosa sp. L2A11]